MSGTATKREFYDIEFEPDDIKLASEQALQRGLSLEVFIIEGVLNGLRKALAEIESSEKIVRYVAMREKAQAEIESNPGTHQFREQQDYERRRKQRMKDRRRNYLDYVERNPHLTDQERVEAAKRFKLYS